MLHYNASHEALMSCSQKKNMDNWFAATWTENNPSHTCLKQCIGQYSSNEKLMIAALAISQRIIWADSSLLYKHELLQVSLPQISFILTEASKKQQKQTLNEQLGSTDKNLKHFQGLDWCKCYKVYMQLRNQTKDCFVARCQYAKIVTYYSPMLQSKYISPLGLRKSCISLLTHL